MASAIFNNMVNYQQGPGREAELDAVFGALADPTRRAILARLAEGSTTVGQLATPFAISLPAVSRHLKVLERAGLLARGWPPGQPWPVPENAGQ